MKKKLQQKPINTTQRDTIIHSGKALEKGDITLKDRENILIMASIPAPLMKTIMDKSKSIVRSQHA